MRQRAVHRKKTFSIDMRQRAVHHKKPSSIGMRQRAVHRKKTFSIDMRQRAVDRKNRRRAVSYVSTGLACLPRDTEACATTAEERL